MRWAHGWVSIFPLSNHHVIASNPNSPHSVHWTPFLLYIRIKFEIGMVHNVWRKLWILAGLYCKGSDKFSPPYSYSYWYIQFLRWYIASVVLVQNVLKHPLQSINAIEEEEAFFSFFFFIIHVPQNFFLQCLLSNNLFLLLR